MILPPAAGSPLPQKELDESFRIEGAVGVRVLRRVFVNDCLVNGHRTVRSGKAERQPSLILEPANAEMNELLKSAAVRNSGSSGGMNRGLMSNCGSVVIGSGFVSTGGRVAAATGPVGMEEFAARLVGSLVGMGSEVVALSLNEVGRDLLASVPVVESQGR